VGIIITIIAVVFRIATAFYKAEQSKDDLIKYYVSTIRMTAVFLENDEGSFLGLENHSDINDIKKSIVDYGGTNFAINVTDDRYCAEVQLKNGNWYCVDIDTAKEFSSNPACSVNHYSCH